MQNFTENPYIISCMYVNPGKEPEVQYLNGTEAQMEDMVHGKIASNGIDEGVCVIHNAFSDVLQMPENRTIFNETFYGPMIVVSFDAFGNIISLTDEDLEYFSGLLALPKAE